MKVLLATIPSDSHTWNLIFMQLFIEELGHQVFNLGSCVPIHLLETEAYKIKPQLIVISTINGHGSVEGADIAKAIRGNKQLYQIPLVIGGKLSTQGLQNSDYVARLYDSGFDGVFEGEDAVDNFVSFVNKLNVYLRPNLKLA